MVKRLKNIFEFYFIHFFNDKKPYSLISLNFFTCIDLYENKILMYDKWIV